MGQSCQPAASILGYDGCLEMEVTGQWEGGEQVGDSQWQHFRAKSYSKELVAKQGVGSGMTQDLWLICPFQLRVRGCWPAVAVHEEPGAEDEEERKPRG